MHREAERPVRGPVLVRGLWVWAASQGWGEPLWSSQGFLCSPPCRRPWLTGWWGGANGRSQQLCWAGVALGFAWDSPAAGTREEPAAWGTGGSWVRDPSLPVLEGTLQDRGWRATAQPLQTGARLCPEASGCGRPSVAPAHRGARRRGPPTQPTGLLAVCLERPRPRPALSPPRSFVVSPRARLRYVASKGYGAEGPDAAPGPRTSARRRHLRGACREPPTSRCLTALSSPRRPRALGSPARPTLSLLSCGSEL